MDQSRQRVQRRKEDKSTNWKMPLKILEKWNYGENEDMIRIQTRTTQYDTNFRNIWKTCQSLKQNYSKHYTSIGSTQNN